MKVLLCCILKMENRYLDEWINYYSDLGIDKIVIYDNNDISGEYAEDIKKVKSVKSGINSKFIDVYPIPGNQPIGIQNTVYDQCYQRYQNDYDWFLFLDLDEFLVLEKFKNIHEYLSQSKFNDFGQIHLNWKLYDDNNIVKSPKKYSVVNTFTRELIDVIPYRLDLNNEMKSIIRGHLGEIKHRNAHTLCYNEKIKSCNAIGIEDSISSFVSKYPLHKGAWINHYITKSLDEYVNIKMNRLKSNGGIITAASRVDLNFFFMYNEYTSEKFKYLNKLIPNLNEKQLLFNINQKIKSQYNILLNEQKTYMLLNNHSSNENQNSKNLIFFNPNKVIEESKGELKKLIFK